LILPEYLTYIIPNVSIRRSLDGAGSMPEALSSASEEGGQCNFFSDVYSKVCSKLGKPVRLCPRLVPAPLWGLSLATLSRLAPEAALAICDWCPEVVGRVSEYWFSLDRSGTCVVCGRPGSEVDEDWLYCLTVEGGGEPSSVRCYKGVAYLQELRLLCQDCHLAKHQGYAVPGGKEKIALEQLAKVNGLSAEEVKELVGKAFRVYAVVSRVRDWSIRVKPLNGLSEELRAGLENLLNTMYRRRFFIHEGWLYYSYPRSKEEVEPRVLHETTSILAETLRRVGTASRWFNNLPERLLEVVREKLEPRGVQVLDNEFRMFVRYIVEDEKRRGYLENIIDSISGSEANIGPLPLGEIGLTGKWIAFVPADLCPRVFRRVIELLEETKLAYSAKIPAEREDYQGSREPPVIIYIPISIAPHYVVDVAEILRKSLNELGVDRRLFYKPDIFTLKGIYYKKSSSKPYIYVY